MPQIFERRINAMLYCCIPEKKSACIRELRRLTGAPVQYSGAPRFIYSVGGYSIWRDGTIQTSAEADPQVMTLLQAKGLTFEPKKELSPVACSLDGMTVQQILKLLFLINAKAALLCAMVGRQDAFRVPDSLCEHLSGMQFDSIDDVRQAITAAGTGVQGIAFSESEILFPGFRFQTTAEHQAYSALAARMIEWAGTHRRCSPHGQTISKYAARIWLQTLGFTGTAYKRIRAVLMKRLPGSSAYAKYEQQKAALKRRQKAAKIAREKTEFIVLE